MGNSLQNGMRAETKDVLIFGSTADVLPQQVKFTFPGNLFTHFGFPEWPCCLQCNIYSRLCHDYGLMIFD